MMRYILVYLQPIKGLHILHVVGEVSQLVVEVSQLVVEE